MQQQYLCIAMSCQDFLIQLDIKPSMHLVELSIFSLNNVTLIPTKIMDRADKNWAHFLKIKYLKNQNFQKHFLLKAGLLVQYSSKKENRKIQSIFNTEKWL